MKRLNYIAGFVAVLLVFCSCNNWIENAQPRSETPEHKMYDSEAGFEAVLTGAYETVAGYELYGEATTMLLPEFMVQNWEPQTTETIEFWLHGYNRSDYRSRDEVRNYISTMWTKYFHAIAQLNSLIANIENTDVNFTGNAKDMIHGEALGLRAFLHLDLLRFFGPIPTNMNPTIAYLPYVQRVSSRSADLAPIPLGDIAPEGSETFDENTYVGRLERDLRRAQELLLGSEDNPVDPIFLYSQEGMSGGGSATAQPTNDYEYWRKRRFNYWAAVATEARLMSWMKDDERASRIALRVITEARGFNGGVLFPLTKEAGLTSSTPNYTMNSEHIFGIENQYLYARLEPRYEGELENIAGSDMEIRKAAMYSQEGNKINSLYDNFFVGDDWRGGLRYYWQQADQGTLYKYRKYVNTIPLKQNQKNRVPVIRISEMYLLYLEGTPDVGSYYWDMLLDDYMESRGILNSATQMSQSMLNNRFEQIKREYRKEFFGEGHTWFFYKRHGLTEIDWPDAASYFVSEDFWTLELPRAGYTDFFKDLYPEIYE
jgi:hypothetical protein